MESNVAKVARGEKYFQRRENKFNIRNNRIFYKLEFF